MKVQPITDLKDIKSIKKLLNSNPRDKLLFVLGINSGLRVGDLLKLKVSDLLETKVGDRISVKEGKTGKDNVLIVNQEILSSFSKYVEESNPQPYHFIFKSRKGSNYPLSVFRVTRLVKEWATLVNLKGNYGAHSLRKTFAYVQRKYFNTSWETLARRLNHSSPSVTRRYICVQAEEVEEILLRNI